MSKVAVLVAVYNAAPFLEECLNSLLQQTLQDIQIICVDDASTDNSLDLLHRYAEQDERIEVIALKTNGGIAHARNEALKHVASDYICMLDADDWFSADALMQAYNIFLQHSHTDSVLFQFVKVFPNRMRPFETLSFEVLSGIIACELSLTWQIHGIYMVRASIHRQYPYDETCRYYSDENTARIHYWASREVRSCGGIYYYRQHAVSSTNKISVRRFDRLRAAESLRAFLRGQESTQYLVCYYENIYWLTVIDLYQFYFRHRSSLSTSDKLYAVAEIKRAWKAVQPRLLESRNRLKFGYMPLYFSWFLFRLQEEIYFSLRWLVDRFSGSKV
jgi:glycosyltransferase, group 2 family protein